MISQVIAGSTSNQNPVVKDEADQFMPFNPQTCGFT